MKLSACYIVKNEAQNLPQSLASLQAAVDEILVVDTGSTDQTRQIASGYGACVYQFSWQNDFSAPRNFALDQAVGDWVIFLDADEAFIHPTAVREAVQSIATVEPDCEGILIPRGSVDDAGRIFNEDYSLRIFQRRPDLRYQGHIHENIGKESGKMNLYRADARLYIQHTGYRAGIIREKCERNLAYLQQEISRHGVQPQYEAFLADCYFGLQKYRQALDSAEQTLASDIEIVGGRVSLHHVRIESLRQLEAPLDVQLQAAEQALAEYPEVPELYGEKGMILCGMQEPDQAYLCLKQAAALYEQRSSEPPAYESYIQAAIDKIYSRIAELEAMAGNTEQAVANWERALTLNPANAQARALYESFQLQNNPEEERHVKISSCYIVKNEARELARSIQSLQEQVDEIIVVDTGSTDETVKVAESLGAKVIQTTWQEDFSAPRNLAMEQVTGDWVVFLDADESFHPDTAGNLRLLIEQQDQSAVNGLLIELLNIDADRGNELLGKSYALRIFRHKRSLWYQGRIHEELRDNGRLVEPCARISPDVLQILHTGYSAARNRSKAERNLRLLQQILHEGGDPVQYSGYLADAYLGVEDYARAAYFARQDTGRGRQATTYASRSWRILLELSEPGALLAAEREALCQQAVADFPEIPEFRADYAECLAGRGDYASAVLEMRQALDFYADYTGLEPTLFTADMARMAAARMEAWQQSQSPVTAQAAGAALRQLAVQLVQVTDDWSACEPWLQLLPVSFQHCLRAIHGEWSVLSAEDEAVYPDLLEWIAAGNEMAGLSACLELVPKLSGQICCQGAQRLMKQWQWEQAFTLYQAVPADSAAVDGVFWKHVGICLFYLQEKVAAMECFGRARDMGVQDKEMESYQVWCQED